MGNSGKETEIRLLPRISMAMGLEDANGLNW